MLILLGINQNTPKFSKITKISNLPLEDGGLTYIVSESHYMFLMFGLIGDIAEISTEENLQVCINPTSASWGQDL